MTKGCKKSFAFQVDPKMYFRMNIFFFGSMAMKESNHHLTYSGHAGKNVLLFISFPGQLDNILLWHGYVVVAESVTLSGKEALSTTTTNHPSNLERQETGQDDEDEGTMTRTA